MFYHAINAVQSVCGFTELATELWKLSCCCDSRSYCVKRTVYWQTMKPVSVTSLRTAGTDDPIQRGEFPNAPKPYLFKRDH